MPLFRSRRSSSSPRKQPYRHRPLRLEELETRTVPTTLSALNDSFSVLTNNALILPAATVRVQQTGDGEVALPAAVNSEFNGTSLPADWQTSNWPAATGGTVAVADGVMTVDGARAGTQALYGPGRSVEFVGTFSGDAFQHAGFGTDFNVGPWAMFSTSGGGSLSARTRTPSGTVQNTPLAGSWLGAPHTFRVDWAAAGVTYSIDGAVVATHALSITAGMRPLIGDLTVGGGAVTVSSLTLIPPGYEVAFTGTDLPSDWTTTTGGQVNVGGGAMTVDGALVTTQALYGSQRSLEFSATFGGEPNQHAGFANNLNNGPWAIFSTNNGGQLFARTRSGAQNQNVLLPGNWLNAAHTFRIDWSASGVSYSIDGAVVATSSIVITTGMRPTVSDLSPGDGNVAVEWLRMTPYTSAGTFASRVFDAGAPATWGTASWTAATPAGTSLNLSVRVGNTPTPDATWTEFQPLAGPGAAIAGAGRYAQYRADLMSTDAGHTPVLESVTLTTAGAGTFTDTTAADFAAGTLGTGILANDHGAVGDPLTAALVSGPAHGALILSPDGSFTYTPDTGFAGADSFVYQAQAPDGTLSDPATVTIDVIALIHAPNLTVADAVGDEGGVIPLTIAASPGVADGTETVSLVIHGLPDGATLSHGTSLGGGARALTVDDLAGLTATLPDTRTVMVSVTATAHSTLTTDTISVIQLFTLSAANVAPTGTLSSAGPVAYGSATVVGFDGVFDPSPAATAAGFHYAFALDPADLEEATYDNSGTDAFANFNLPAGTHTIYARIIDQNDGYTETQVVVTVNKAASVLTWSSPAAITYGTALGAAQLNAGADVAGTVSYSHPAGTVLNAGAGQTLTATFTPADPANYESATATVTLTVNKAALIITANNASMNAGASLPTFTLQYSGFVNGDTAASLTTQPFATTTATSASPAGNYAIIVGGATSNNYVITHVGGTLTVNATAYTISGVNFYDSNGDGIKNDPGVVSGWTVYLDNDANFLNGYVAKVKTDAYGRYTFTSAGTSGAGVAVVSGLTAGTWYVYEGTPSSLGWLQTLGGGTNVFCNPNPFVEVHATGGAYRVSLAATQLVSANNHFGNLKDVISCGGASLGFWTNKLGQLVLFDGGTNSPELEMLENLELVTTSVSGRTAVGVDFDPSSYSQLRTWLLSANAKNMAHMLSAQLAVTALNVEAGFLNLAQVVRNLDLLGFRSQINNLIQNKTLDGLNYTNNGSGLSSLGYISIGDMMLAANEAIKLDAYTASGDTTMYQGVQVRALQSVLKSALETLNSGLFLFVAGW